MALGIQHGQCGGEDEQSGAAERVQGDAPAQRSAGAALYDAHERYQTQEPERPQERQNNDRQVGQVAEEPAAPARRQDQADKIVDAEQCPHAVDDELGRLLGRALRVGEYLPGVDAQEDDGGAGQWPLGGSFPRPQPSVRADVSRHASNGRRRWGWNCVAITGGDIRRRWGHVCAVGGGLRVRGPESCPRTRRMSPSGAVCTRPRGTSPPVLEGGAGGLRLAGSGEEDLQDGRGGEAARL